MTDQFKENTAITNAIASQPYQEYEGSRVADLNDDQQAGLNILRNSTNTWRQDYEGAQRGAGAALDYTPDLIQAPNLEIAPHATAAAIGTASAVKVADAGTAPAATAATGTLAPAVTASTATLSRTDRADIGTMSAEKVARGDVRLLSAGQLNGTDLSDYTNPYDTKVVDAATTDLRRENDAADNALRARFAAAGAFGGSRQAVAQAENQRNFTDAEARMVAGLHQQGYQQAQAAATADIDRTMAADQANLAVDQALALANQQTAQQTRATNFAADRDVAFRNQDAANQSAQFNAGLSQQANLANAQADNEMSRYNAGLKQQAELANKQADGDFKKFNAGLKQQAAVADAQANNDIARTNAGFNQQIALANQTADANIQQLNLQQRQQAALANQQAIERTATIDLDASRMLSTLSAQNQGQTAKDANNLLTGGGLAQQQDQKGLDDAYKEFLRRQQYPIEMLKLREDVLRGVPYGTTSTQTTTSAASDSLDSLFGGGGGGSLSKALGVGSSVVDGLTSILSLI